MPWPYEHWLFPKDSQSAEKAGPILLPAHCRNVAESFVNRNSQTQSAWELETKTGKTKKRPAFQFRMGSNCGADMLIDTHFGPVPALIFFCPPLLLSYSSRLLNVAIRPNRF